MPIAFCCYATEIRTQRTEAEKKNFSRRSLLLPPRRSPREPSIHLASRSLLASFFCFVAAVATASTTSTSGSSPPLVEAMAAAATAATAKEIVSRCACGSTQICVSVPKSGEDLPGSSCWKAVDCHCPGCRKFHAAAFVSYLSVPADRVRVETVNSNGEGVGSIRRFPDTCGEVGAVDRWVCPRCSSKLASTPRRDGGGGRSPTGGGENGSSSCGGSPTVLVNMGPLVDSSVPRGVLDQWKRHRDRWQMSSGASWAFAKPLAAGWSDDDDDDDDDDEDDDESDDDDEESGSEEGEEAAEDEDDDEQQESEGIYGEHTAGAPAATSSSGPGPRTLRLSGGCSCGATRYWIEASSPSDTTTELQHCYCRLCRQLSGGPFMTWLPVEKANILWTTTKARTALVPAAAAANDGKGEKEGSYTSADPPPLIRTTSHGRRHFCPHCSSCLTIAYDDQPDCVWPAAGSLDDECLPKTPQTMGEQLYRVVHICCRYKQRWYQLPRDGLPRIQEAG